MSEHDNAPSDTDLPEVHPLLEQAEQIAELPLADRPAALQRLNSALVAELNALEEV